MDNNVYKTEFIATGHLDDFEKYNDKYCFLKVSGNPNLPDKVAISKENFSNNYDSVLRVAKGNPKYDIHFKGVIKKHNNQFFFNVKGVMDLVPTPLWTEEELDSEINKFFSGER